MRKSNNPQATLVNTDLDVVRMPIAARKHPEVWIISGFAILGTIMLVNFLVFNPRWQWDVVATYLFDPLVIAGLRRTIYLTVIASIAGLLLGIVVALTRLSSIKVVSTISALYVWFIRAIPALVLLLLIYFGAALLPRLAIGIPFGPALFSVSTNDVISQFTAAVVGLALIQGAYTGEIFRGGILSVPHGQIDAAKAIGLSGPTAFRRIVLPQATRVVIPAMGNEMITMFKNTSLVFVIGYSELLTTVQFIYGRTYQTIPLLMVACLWYLFLTSIATLGQRQLEKRYGRGYQRSKLRGAVADTPIRST